MPPCTEAEAMPIEYKAFVGKVKLAVPAGKKRERLTRKQKSRHLSPDELEDLFVFPSMALPTINEETDAEMATNDNLTEESINVRTYDGPEQHAGEDGHDEESLCSCGDDASDEAELECDPAEQDDWEAQADDVYSDDRLSAAIDAAVAELFDLADHYEALLARHRHRYNYQRASSAYKKDKITRIHVNSWESARDQRRANRIAEQCAAEKANRHDALNFIGFSPFGHHRGPPAQEGSFERDLQLAIERSRADIRRHVVPPGQAKQSAALRSLDAQTQSALIALQFKELTPADYELLLALDASVAPKTLSRNQIASLPMVTLPSGPVDGHCGVCLEPFAGGAKVRQLPCGHHFHPVCIDTWLSRASVRCPMDNLPLFDE